MKNHTYFHGIDWDMVAKRKFVAPFEPTVFKMDLEIPMDPASLFNITTDGDVKQTTAERLNCELREESNDSIGFFTFFPLNYRLFICCQRTSKLSSL